MNANTIDRSTIPDENDVQGRSLSRWRIADGKFKRGRDKDGTLEERDPNKMVGQIVAFRVFEGSGDKGPYEQLEVDIQCRHGMEYVKVNKNMDKGYWPTQGVGLAKFMCAVEEGKNYFIEPQLAKNTNSYGTRNTFVDVARLDENGRACALTTEWDGEKFADISDAVFDALHKHPLYKDREAPKAESDKTERDWFLEMLEAKSWPEYEGNEAAYVEALNSELLKADNGAIAVEDMDDDYFNFARQAWDAVNECPIGKTEPAKAEAATPKAEVKKPGLKKPSATPISDGQVNPFKDE